jgi:hypothetical protein
MLRFKQFLEEKVLSIGLNPKHEKFREKHRADMHDVIRKSYSNVEGGYAGLGQGSKEESDAIHNDISNSAIKAIRRDGRITAVNLYKKSHGRKSIAMGHDGTDQGKKDVRQIMSDDKKKERSWSEVSGAVEHIRRKMGYPVIPSSRAKELTGKSDVKEIDPEKYERQIGKEKHIKTLMGYPKKD